jgi:phosphate transport system substrate-binding protein
MNRGETTLAVDESFAPVFISLLAGFKAAYPQVNVRMREVSEAEGLRLFLADSTKLLALPRPLNATEEAAYKQKYKFTPRWAVLAGDGIQVVVHPQQRDTNLTFTQLKAILAGELTHWSQLRNVRDTSGKRIIITLDQNGSSLVHHLQDSVLAGKKLASRVFAAGSSPKVVDYVATNPNALGFIGYNWLNGKNPTAPDLYKRVKLVGLSPEGDESRQKYIRLNDESVIYYLKNRRYPLQRLIYLINGDTPNSPGAGFLHYASGQQGQLIIYQANLVPKRLPLREVELQPGTVPEIN